MKRFAIQTLVTGALAVGMWGIASAEHSDTSTAREGEGRTCTAKTLRGSYLFVASGFNIVGGAAIPKALHEALEFNGDGTLTTPAVTLSVNGNISHPPGAPGDYTVEDNCHGTIVFTGGPSFDIVVGPGGQTVWMFQTNSGTVFQGTATRIDR
jgi:hypothetical protein